MKSVALASLAVLVALWAAPGPAVAAPPDSFEEAGRIVDYWTQRLRSLGAEIVEQVQSGRAPRGPMHGHGHGPMRGLDGMEEERPLITMMLHHQRELGLTAEQVAKLESIRADFTRDAIRREADIRIGELDLDALLRADPVDFEKVEAKVRELAQARADLRIARLRALEQGKAVLTADQRTRLESLMRSMPHGPGRMGGPRRSAEHTERQP